MQREKNEENRKRPPEGGEMISEAKNIRKNKLMGSVAMNTQIEDRIQNRVRIPLHQSLRVFTSNAHH